MLLSKDSHSIYNLHPIVSIFLLLGLHLAILYFLYFIRYFVNIHTKSIDLNQELIKAVNQYEKFRLDYNMNDLINSIPELQVHKIIYIYIYIDACKQWTSIRS